ncbi:replication initiation protein RepM [Psychrobacter sp. JCM 18903]|uniref:replication initiation protein RepM n=1 Tax=Psychrobacter sp. JCM 18903 TaxID=1298610 RepID=UPI0004B4D475|nr:replication initiation protein RepM [Psychrobacter sp. JCM 18903]
MSKQLVTKDNSLIGASYSLGVVEQRLIFLAIIEAREQKTLIEAGGVLRIYAQSYAKQFNVEKHTSYEAMKRAVEGLYEAGFAYSKIDERSGKIGHYKSRWVDKIGYIDDLGCVELVFASDVIPLITRLEARYTEYELKQVVGLQSEYAIRLYELIIQWRSVGRTSQISLVELREKLGLVDEYQRIEAFKRRVLDLAITQINEHTDITVEYEQHKQGRIITGFTFKFKVKTNKRNITAKDESENSDSSTIEGLNDKQLGRIARNPDFMAEYNHLVSLLAQLGSHSKRGSLKWLTALKKMLHSLINVLSENTLNTKLTIIY